MHPGAITGYIDVAQLTLYAFWIFFAGLILYLRREDKREGYPLQSERSGSIRHQGFPELPAPKTFILPRGGVTLAPRAEAPVPVMTARPVGPWLGAPLHPTGNPMLDCVGPASYANRADVPEAMYETGAPKLVPLRLATECHVDLDDPDPRGKPVVGADDIVAGTIVDLWVDRAEMIIRYLELETMADGLPRRALLPMPMARVSRRRVKVASILAHQFALVPPTKHPDQVTLLEEDKIQAYYGSGHLYATPARLGPLF